MQAAVDDFTATLRKGPDATHLWGAETNGPAVDTDIKVSLIWMGLLVNELSGTTPGSENSTTGGAHPLEGETRGYLQGFPESPTEANADTDAIPTNGNGFTDGSYHWVVLHNTDAVPAYQSGTTWFAGPNGTIFP